MSKETFFREFTELSKQALQLGREGNSHWAFAATLCPTCDLLFLDGVEGNAEDERCDSCWYECYTAEDKEEQE